MCGVHDFKSTLFTIAIILNSLKDKGAGFATDTNKVTFIDHEQRQVHFELKSKTAVANDIMNEILNKIDA